MITIDQDQWSTIEDTLSEFGEPTDSYSGRGMYGAQCIGVTVDRFEEAGLWDMALSLARRDRWLAEDLGQPRSDSMGLGTIYYWPNVSVEAEEEEE